MISLVTVRPSGDEAMMRSAEKESLPVNDALGSSADSAHLKTQIK